MQPKVSWQVSGETLARKQIGRNENRVHKIMLQTEHLEHEVEGYVDNR